MALNDRPINDAPTCARQALTRRTLSVALRIKPPAFQFGSAGCVSPFALVQRACRVNVPDEGTPISAFHWRKPYLPSSGFKTASRQVAPLSADHSTFATPQSQPNAIPLTDKDVPGFTFASLVKLVKKERGAIRLIGTVANPLSPGLTFAWGVSGMRYAVFIQ